MGCFARPDGVRRIPDLVPQLFPYLKDNLDRPGGVLSGGQQQQLAIARALATDPKVLLLDEPCEGIQPSIVEEIENIILEINKTHGIAVVLVEQNVEFARRACDRFVIVEKSPSSTTRCRASTPRPRSSTTAARSPTWWWASSRVFRAST